MPMSVAGFISVGLFGFADHGAEHTQIVVSGAVTGNAGKNIGVEPGLDGGRTGCLQFAVIDRAREGNHIADVAHTGQVHDAALKAKTEARVPSRTILAQIKIEAIVFGFQSELVHAA